MGVFLESGRLAEFNAAARAIALQRFNGYVNLGQSYALFGDFSKAEYWMERSTRDQPDWERSRYNRQFVPQWRGDTELAQQLLERGMKSEGLRIEDEPQGQTGRGRGGKARFRHVSSRCRAIRWTTASTPATCRTSTSQRRTWRDRERRTPDCHSVRPPV